MTYTDRTFVDLVLPDNGLFVIATFASTNDQDVIPYQKFAYDKTQLIRATASDDANRRNTVYFCTASVSSVGLGHKHTNVLAKKCLHIDIDVGHEGFVMKQTEAVSDLYALCDIAGIPPPSVIVSSGSGVHAYWSMREQFNTSDMRQWQQLSRGLVAAAEQHAPRIVKDISKWTDRTALLRLPGTRNKKHASWSIVQEIGGTYAEYPRHDFDALLAYAPELPEVYTGGKSTRQISAVDGDVLKSNCLVLRDLVSRPKIGYHSWRDIIWYSHHTTQGVQWAHEISEGPDYNPKLLDKLYDDYANSYEVGDYRPPRCTTLCSDAGVKHADACVTCPLFLANKTPLSLTVAKPIAVVPTSDITTLHTLAALSVERPEFLRGQETEAEACTYSIMFDGGLGRTPTQHSQEDQGGKVFSSAWWCISRAEELSFGKTVTFYDIARVESVAADRDDNGVQHIVPTRITRHRVRGDIFSEMNTLIKGLASVGIHVEDTGRGTAKQRRMAYAYASVARKYCDVVYDAASSFGWQRDGRFVMGMGAFRPGGDIVAYSMTGPLQKADNGTSVASTAINPSGNELGVIHAMSEFNTHSSPLGKAIFLAAIATPLFKLIGLRGYVLLLAGQGGKGKTSMQRLLSSIYGRPDESMIASQDSAISWSNTVALYNSIPVTFDEFTNAAQHAKNNSDENKDAFIFGVTVGRTKKVGSAEQVQLGGNDTWSTLVVASSNWDYVASLKVRDMSDRCDAILARVSQIQFSDGIMPFSDWKRVERLFYENHGLIGAKFMSQVMARKDDVEKMLAAELVGQMAGLPTEARFKRMLLSAIMVAQRLLAVGQIVDFGMSSTDIEQLLELDRLDYTRSVGQWNAGSVVEVGSEANETFIDYILQLRQDAILHYREDQSGVQLPVATAMMARNVIGVSVEHPNGDMSFTLSKVLIANDRDIKAIPASASVIASAEQIRARLTQGTPEVTCIRIWRRKQQPLLGSGVAT